MNKDWNLNLIISEEELKNIEKYKKNLKTKAYEFINKWKDRKDYLEDEKVLKEALDEYVKWRSTDGYPTADYFYSLSLSLKQGDADLKAKNKKFEDFWDKIENDVLFFTHNISTKVSKNNQKKFLNSNLLNDYRHFLKKEFEFGAHQLSEAEEKLMNRVSTYASRNWFDMLQEFFGHEEAEIEVKGKKTNLNFSQILEKISDDDQKTRDSAAEALNKIFKKHLKTSEHEINNIYQFKATMDEFRKFERPDSARHMGDDVSTKTIDMFIKTVTDSFDLPQRFYKLKAKLYGKDKLAYHERNLEYGNADKKYEFEVAYKMVEETFNNLDPKFATVFKRFFANGQVDVETKKGKVSGAFCSFGNVNIPTYVLLNHVGSLNNVLTMAHEFGHAFHFEFSKENQNYLNIYPPMCTAETASTFFEDFVLEEILKEANDEERLSILMMKLNDDVSTIFRQIAFYNFELDLHNKVRKEGYVNAENIGKLFKKHMVSYMGEGVSQDEGAENWWVYIPHFRYSFYVYSYAFGLLISKALQKMVHNNPKDISKVIAFLSAGSHKTPKEIFNDLGIDIDSQEFWQNGLSEIKELIDETESLAKKLGKI